MTARLVIILVAAASLATQTSTAPADIENVLTAQVQAWNRGDIPKFVSTYAEDCIFVGKQILQGRSKLLARYQKTYPSPESMGRLTFQNLAVRPLDSQIATALASGTSIDHPLPVARSEEFSVWCCNSVTELGRLYWITQASAINRTRQYRSDEPARNRSRFG